MRSGIVVLVAIAALGLGLYVSPRLWPVRYEPPRCPAYDGRDVVGSSYDPLIGKLACVYGPVLFKKAQPGK